jgi:uncharacterized protein
MLNSQSTRHEIPDALKALALLGVFMVNGLGYALSPYYLLQIGAPIPLESVLAHTAHAAALTFFMGKALPFLVFLFGFSMANYASRAHKQGSFKRRQYKLLLVGILHGAFVYFGDILTSYAIVGLWLGSAISLRGRKLILHWRFWILLSAAIILFKLYFEWKYYQPALELDAVAELDSFFKINFIAYFGSTVGWLLSYYAPLHIGLFITGIFAARYQWLSLRPRMPQLFIRPWLYRGWPLALLANLCLALASVHLHREHGLKASVSWIALLNVPLGVWMIASSLSRLMLHIQTAQTIPRLLVWLAPAGRHTLAMYLGLSVLLAMSGRLGLFTSQTVWNHTAVWFVGLLLFWLAAVCVGRAATKRQRRDPISRWLSR